MTKTLQLNVFALSHIICEAKKGTQAALWPSGLARRCSDPEVRGSNPLCGETFSPFFMFSNSTTSLFFAFAFGESRF